MRIALFSETYLPHINGVVTHVHALRTGLEKLGHEVLVVCANPDTKHYYIEDGVLNCPGISIKKMYDYGVATPISPIRYRYIKEFNPDIIHIHNEFGVGYSGVAAAKSLDVPLIYTMHTMYDDYLYYIAPKRLINVAKKTSHAYTKSLATKATCLTGPSKKVEEFFRECGVEKEVHIIPNPVEIDLFVPGCADDQKKQEIRENYKIKKDDLVLCFCGRLGREKSVDVLLDFWKQEIKPEDKCKLMIIGEGPSEEELKAQAESLNISDMVCFTGRVEHEELPPYYDSCDLYITVSLSDTNSISMLEGMATGLPVLHIKDELNKGQVVDGINGYIFNSAEQMKELIVKYKNMSTEEKEEFKKESRKSVEQSGDKTLAKNLLEVYKEAQSIKLEKDAKKESKKTIKNK